MSGQKLYISYCNDRHIDPVINVFTDKDKAIEFTRSFMNEHMAYPDGIEEILVKGYILNLIYNYAEDNAFVIEAILDEPSN